MRLTPYALRRFWHVHAWAGVITSLVVYVMFMLGAVVLFYRPLTIWEEPLQQRPAVAMTSLQGTLDLAQGLPDEFYYYLPKGGHGLPKLGYYLPDTTKWRMWWIDPDAGRVVPQRELTAAYVYDLHYLWHDITGYWLQYGAGVLVFGFLLAIVTGVLIHLRDVMRQLHRFRPHQPPRVAWSDLHKVTGMIGLPFQLVYALTGALMALSPLVFQLSISPVFGGDEVRAVATAGALVEEPPPRDYGARGNWLSIDELVARAKAAEPRIEPESFVIRGYRRAAGTIDVRGHIHGIAFGDGLVRLRGADGSVELAESPDRGTAVGAVARWIHGLHTVEYGGLAVRFLLFLLAVGGCLMILTGNWIWLERRAARSPSRGTQILGRLTAGVGAGAIVAFASLVLASRLLPMDWPARTRAEEIVLAATFVACVGAALVTRRSAVTWWRALGLAGAMLLIVPIAALGHSSAGLYGGGPRDATVVGVEIGFTVIGAALVAAALAIRRFDAGAHRPWLS